MIPNFNGGASAGALGPDSETVKLLKRAGQPNLKQISKQLPLYWGPQPFTAGPMFIGGITIFLFLLGIFCYKGKERWWLLAATVLAIFLALGHHFMGFTKFCYEYLPLYNKFRTVSMALCVLQISVPLLGFIFLDRLVREEIPAEELRKKGLYAFVLTGGVCLLFWLFPGLAGSFTGASDTGMQDALVDALVADRISLLRTDAGVSFLLIAAAAVLVWWISAQQVRARRAMAAIGICLLVLVNMFAVGKRYLSGDDFVTPKNFMSQFDQRPADKAILADTDPSYRVLDLSVNVFNDSHPSFWHKNIGGYSPAKLQIYQEYIENHLAGEIRELSSALKGVSTVAAALSGRPFEIELPLYHTGRPGGAAALPFCARECLVRQWGGFRGAGELRAELPALRIRLAGGAEADLQRSLVSRWMGAEAGRWQRVGDVAERRGAAQRRGPSRQAQPGDAFRARVVRTRRRSFQGLLDSADTARAGGRDRCGPGAQTAEYQIVTPYACPVLTAGIYDK